jgi:hypothetical protein
LRTSGLFISTAATFCSSETIIARLSSCLGLSFQ